MVKLRIISPGRRSSYVQRNHNEHNFLSAVTFIGQASPSPRKTRQPKQLFFSCCCFTPCRPNKRPVWLMNPGRRGAVADFTEKFACTFKNPKINFIFIRFFFCYLENFDCIVCWIFFFQLGVIITPVLNQSVWGCSECTPAVLLPIAIEFFPNVKKESKG